MPRMALLSTSDTDLLSARASGADFVWANPARPTHQDLGAALEGADIVVARILGGPQDLCSGFRRIAATGTRMVVLGGEQRTDEILRNVGKGDRRAAHFAKLGDQLGVTAVNPQGNLQLNTAQGLDGWEAGAKIEEGPAETEYQATKSG